LILGYNGPEFISHELIDWAIKEQITLKNAGLENQHKMPILSDLIARHELLELNLFEDIEHAQLLVTQWQ
jgi:putative transposase